MSRVLSILLLSIALVAPTFQQVPEDTLPNGKKSDGCSMFPDGDYRACCVEHDKVYFYGGPKEQRLKADQELQSCVRAKGHKYLAPMMYLGVRIGGVGFLPTPFRWGFGKK